jgi:hypothetical protein
MSLGLWRLLRTKSLSPGGPTTDSQSCIALECILPLKQIVLTLGLRVARQHALDTDAHALHIMHWAPSLRVQQV